MATQTIVEQIRKWIEKTFPEKQIVLGSAHGSRRYILSPRKQCFLAIVAIVLLAWFAVTTLLTLFLATEHGGGAEHQIAMLHAQTDRWVADRQARLDMFSRRMANNTGSLDQLTRTVEARDAGLAALMKYFKGMPGAVATLSPVPSDDSLAPIERIFFVRADQERLVTEAAKYSKARADRLRMVFRAAGLNPNAYSGPSNNPLSQAASAHAVALMYGVDDDFAERLRTAAIDLSNMNGLQQSAERLPFTWPAYGTRMSSGFGVRFDPFNHKPKGHSGQDMAGPYLTPIYATAPGIVSFVGVRNGYGNVVEIDHGNGYKTRFAHLAAYSVRTGQRVKAQERIASMGSTGRSTGNHLHYEIWINGVAQNPARFLKASDLLH